MKKNRKLVLLLIVLCILIFICILFRVSILENIIKPLTFTILMLLYFFVFSIDQTIIWALMILISFLIFIYQDSASIVLNKHNESNPLNFYIDKFESWKNYFSLKSKKYYMRNDLKKELLKIMVKIYAAKHRLHVNHILFDLFKDKKVRLPENIYSFLFNKEDKIPFFALRRIFYRISGRQAGDHSRNLEECLLFLEKYMELKDEYESQ